MAGELVLVVDDNPLNVKLLRFVLEARGYRVSEAPSAERARGVLEEERPSLILMDVHLPGTDGLTLTRELRGDPRFAHTPIVAISASAMTPDRVAARDAGCDDFVAKPIDTRTFGALLDRFIRAA
jgi:CheY-like chemotaxis protein